jgi:hypothetical protein
VNTPGADTLGLERFLTKRVSFTYRGNRIELALSQSLFSSAEVDRGSALLLKSLSSADPLPGPEILDLGCGTGVLGIAASRAAPGSRLWLQDRDALAVAFAGWNAEANGVTPACLSGDLAFTGLEGRRFDLLLSNLPAKAGEPVHAAMMADAARHLAPEGLAAVVVVEPIATRIRSAVDAAGLRAEEAARTSTHVVFHARHHSPAAPPPPEPPDPLAPYVRGRAAFALPAVTFEIDTCYDLPEFDTLSHATALALEVAEDPRVLDRLDRPVLVWNPGQGHVPAFLSARRPARSGGLPPGPLTLVSRDMLALRASSRAAPTPAPTCLHAWDPAAATGPFGCAFLFPDDEPHVRWEEYLPALAREILEPGGLAVVAAGATFMARLLRQSRGLELVRSRKRAGARSVLLRKP